jgi:heme-degrading monooxygenase HmoA
LLRINPEGATAPAKLQRRQSARPNQPPHGRLARAETRPSRPAPSAVVADQLRSRLGYRRGSLLFRTVQARVARYEIPRDRTGDAVEAFGGAAGELEQLDGFVGGYVLVDHEDARTMTVTLWENLATLENSERQAGRLRRAAADSVGGSVLSVEKYEVSHEMRPAGTGT